LRLIFYPNLFADVTWFDILSKAMTFIHFKDCSTLLLCWKPFDTNVNPGQTSFFLECYHPELKMSMLSVCIQFLWAGAVLHIHIQLIFW